MTLLTRLQLRRCIAMSTDVLKKTPDDRHIFGFHIYTRARAHTHTHIHTHTHTHNAGACVRRGDEFAAVTTVCSLYKCMHVHICTYIYTHARTHTRTNTPIQI